MDKIDSPITFVESLNEEERILPGKPLVWELGFRVQVGGPVVSE